MSDFNFEEWRKRALFLLEENEKELTDAEAQNCGKSRIYDAMISGERRSIQRLRCWLENPHIVMNPTACDYKAQSEDTGTEVEA